MNDRPGCLSGLLKLFLLDALTDWLQKKFGFGRGGFCGCGCGFLIFIFSCLVGVSVLLGTDWLNIGF
jgi:hypothetical protein